MPLIRLTCLAVAVCSTASCGLLAPLFGMEGASDDTSLYQSAMADYALCETAPDAVERAAAAARLATAARTMAAVTQSSNPDHFYETDRVSAAHRRCQEVLGTS